MTPPPHISTPSKVIGVPEDDSVSAWAEHPVGFSAFTTVMAFTNAGISMRPSFNGTIHPLVLVVIDALVLAGNTLFPVLLRWAIVFLNGHSSMESNRKVYFRYLLINGRNHYAHLFTSQQTWLLLTLQVIFITAQSLALRHLGDASITTNQAVFESINTRHAGFGAVDLASENAGVLILMLAMMALAPTPFMLVLQRSHAEAETTKLAAAAAAVAEAADREGGLEGGLVGEPACFDADDPDFLETSSHGRYSITVSAHHRLRVGTPNGMGTPDGSGGGGGGDGGGYGGSSSGSLASGSLASGVAVELSRLESKAGEQRTASSGWWGGGRASALLARRKGLTAEEVRRKKTCREALLQILRRLRHQRGRHQRGTLSEPSSTPHPAGSSPLHPLLSWCLSPQSCLSSICFGVARVHASQ